MVIILTFYLFKIDHQIITSSPPARQLLRVMHAQLLTHLTDRFADELSDDLFLYERLFCFYHSSVPLAGVWEYIRMSNR